MGEQLQPTIQPLDSVLLALDLGPSTDRVIDRVSLLPLAPGAGMTLLHVVPKLRAPETRRRMERDARAALHSFAGRLARRIPRAISISTIVARGTAAPEIVEHARAVRADVVVMGGVRSTTSRVIRRAKRPVLVVRLAAWEYRKPLLALDFDDTSVPMLRFLPRVLGAPRPPVALLHAYETPFHTYRYPSPSREAAVQHRVHCREQAAYRIANLIGATWPDEIRWQRHVLYGAPRSVIASTAANLDCDLLVVGVHGRSGIIYACLGSVALDVLREVRCDVLVVPPSAG